MKSKNKKIVIIHNVISPHILPVFTELAKKVDLKVLFCAHKESNRSWKEKPTGFKYTVLSSKRLELRGKDLFTLFINFNVREQLEKGKPDLVILAGWDLPTYYIAALYCTFKKIPYIVWSGSTKYEESWRRSISKPLVRALLQGASGYIAYGLRARNYLIMLGCRPDKITIAYNSIDIDKYLHPTTAQKKFADNLFTKHKLNSKTVLLFYGQLIERKRPDLLIAAAAKLQKKHTDLAVLIVGSGPLENKLHEQLKVQRLTTAAIISNPGDEYMPGILAKAHVFVLPSDEEVWGLVVNQAMAAGTPVVASNKVGCVDDLIIPEFTGLTFSAGDVPSLAKQLQLLLSKPQLSKNIAKAARQRIVMTKPKNVAEQIAQACSTALSSSQIAQAGQKHPLTKIITLPTIVDECSLTFGEFPLLPFVPKRIYYIYDATSDWPRGYHAHRKTVQVLFCIRGSITIVLEDGSKRETLSLSEANKGVLLEPYVWHEMHDFKKDTVLLVVASEVYDPADYIRDYNEFLELARTKE